MSHFQKHLFICCNEREDGTGCQGTTLLDRAKRYGREVGLDVNSVRINKAGCLGRCDVGPAVVVYPEGQWYSASNEADIEEIVREHLVHGRLVDRLKI
jgi:(2Fe-2S) ferredoxin